MNNTDQAAQRPPRILFPAFQLGLLCWLVCVFAGTVSGQQQPIGQGSQPGQGNQGNVFGGFGNGAAAGLEGGSAQADFDSLIDLIQSTVAADTWMENGTGEGEISPFPTGVFVDARGTLRFTQPELGEKLLSRAPDEPDERVAGDVRSASPLRFVSLPRLEAAILRRQMAHQPLLPEMLTLAGLQRIEYVLVDPERRDLVLAGPAGDWQVELNGRIVSTQTGQPVVRLDDLLTLWRRRQSNPAAWFGCSIIPRQESLAKTQEYIEATSREPIEPSGRGDWLQGLRESLGKQDVKFFGIHAASHVSRVLLAADYHMKLIGMGIADGVEGVESYLSTVRLMPDGSAPPMSVLRWWFAMHYEPVEVSADRNLFRLSGQGVKVLSENELLAAHGQRIHTGQSDELNRRFADSFTEHFEATSTAYPLYGELRNVFDLSLMLAIIEREGLMERVGWQAPLFSSVNVLRLPRVAVPREVETVVNHRVINRRHIIAGVSGGVWVDARKSLHIRAAATEWAVTMVPSKPPASAEDLWWWDQPSE
ncbi:MAG: DUF1598 domain-containing protein [Planctomycetes bacterium]|nr:DUF1598 domain-containing protein [Planctomycetota bacterium]